MFLLKLYIFDVLDCFVLNYHEKIEFDMSFKRRKSEKTSYYIHLGIKNIQKKIKISKYLFDVFKIIRTKVVACSWSTERGFYGNFTFEIRTMHVWSNLVSYMVLVAFIYLNSITVEANVFTWPNSTSYSSSVLPKRIHHWTIREPNLNFLAALHLKSHIHISSPVMLGSMIKRRNMAKKSFHGTVCTEH